MNRLNVLALAVAVAIAWAVLVLFAGWAAVFGWCDRFVDVMSSVYIGYAGTLLGGLIGALWAVVDGLIAGAIIALVYNTVAARGTRPGRPASKV
jgi:hypothetical protein